MNVYKREVYLQKIFTIGETIFDIIFENDIPIAAKAGGAMLNTSVSLGRLGLPITFISEMGNDMVGNKIRDFLIENNISSEALVLYDGFSSPLALAFLDENKKANYTFYRSYPEKRLTNKFPKTNANDIILFGSIYAISIEIRKQLYNFLTEARNKNTIILYDPNFRKPEKGITIDMLKMIEENISISTIVKGSDEDFMNIYNVSNANDAYKIINQKGCNHLIYTKGADGVDLISNGFVKHYETPSINPISTIGAGDTFNAGIIYSLNKLEITNKALSNIQEIKWDFIINNAINFATHVCLSYDNYLNKTFAFNFCLT